MPEQLVVLGHHIAGVRKKWIDVLPVLLLGSQSVIAHRWLSRLLQGYVSCVVARVPFAAPQHE
jgi:hypothetical protein